MRADVGGGGTRDKAPPATPAGPPLAASPGQTPSSGVGPRTQLLFNDVVDVSGGASEGGEDEDVGGVLPQGGDAGGVQQFAAKTKAGKKLPPAKASKPPKPNQAGKNTVPQWKVGECLAMFDACVAATERQVESQTLDRQAWAVEEYLAKVDDVSLDDV